MDENFICTPVNTLNKRRFNEELQHTQSRAFVIAHLAASFLFSIRLVSFHLHSVWFLFFHCALSLSLYTHIESDFLQVIFIGSSFHWAVGCPHPLLLYAHYSFTSRLPSCVCFIFFSFPFLLSLSLSLSHTYTHTASFFSLFVSPNGLESLLASAVRCTFICSSFSTQYSAGWVFFLSAAYCRTIHVQLPFPLLSHQLMK